MLFSFLTRDWLNSNAEVPEPYTSQLCRTVYYNIIKQYETIPILLNDFDGKEEPTVDPHAVAHVK